MIGAFDKIVGKIRSLPFLLSYLSNFIFRNYYQKE